MARDLDVYLYGMTVLTTAHRMVGEFPAPDGYGEIVESHAFPGGETGSAALLLAHWGYTARIAGPHLGTETRDPILDLLGSRNVDCSELQFDQHFPGVRDLVLVADGTRTVFGWFGAYFQGEKRWSPPCEESIRSARIVTIDPFFGDESVLAAEMCVRNAKPYVTIDCALDGFLHAHAAATIVSNEYVSGHFPASDRRELFETYRAASDGLTIFTYGSREILYGRRGEETGCVTPFRVDARSTLGAGDTFRSGVVHGLLSGMDDPEVVTFAAATSACVCRRFPMAFDPPGLEEIEDLAGATTTVRSRSSRDRTRRTQE